MTDVCEKKQVVSNHPRPTNIASAQLWPSFLCFEPKVWIYFWMTDVYIVIDTKTPAEWPEMAMTCVIQNNFISRGSFQLIFWEKNVYFFMSTGHCPDLSPHRSYQKPSPPLGGGSGRLGQVPNSFRKQIFPKGTKKWQCCY